MILGTKARYAVMAMVDLAAIASERPVRLTEIAQRQEIPPAYLEQIFARLRQRGMIKSSKGPGGGYRLARTAGEIALSEIVVAAEEELKMTRCDTHAGRGCMASKARCLTHDLWDGLSAHIYNYFDAITLQDVLDRNAGRSENADAARDSTVHNAWGNL